MNKIISKKHHYPLGIAILLLGAWCMATMGVFVKRLHGDLAWNEVIFFRFFLSLLFFLPFLKMDKKFSYRIKAPSWLIVRIIGGASSMALYFYVMKDMNLSNATLLVMSAPIYIPLFALILFNEKISRLLWIGILTAMAGIVIIFHPNSSIFHSVALLGVLSGMLQGLANLATNKTYQSNNTNQILFYYFLVTTLILACTLPFDWQLPTWTQAIDLVYISIFGALFTLCYTLAFKYAPSYVLSPFALTAIVFSALYDWMIWQQIPKSFMFIGTGVLFLGLMIIIYNKRLCARNESQAC
ncbi:MAG: DMT family transporter [Gammaproteobacteria bacterium]|nr:DMT family transporter [Gammaproteobacteria bacterium]